MKGFLGIAGALLAGVVLGALVWGFCTGGPDDGPEVLKAKAAVAEAQDARQASAMRNAGIARRVDCYAASVETYDTGTGRPRFLVAEYPGGYFECFENDGARRYNKRTGDPLQEMARGDAERYLKSHPKPVEAEPPPELPTPRQAWGRPPRRAARQPELHEIQELDCREVGCN